MDTLFVDWVEIKTNGNQTFRCDVFAKLEISFSDLKMGKEEKKKVGASCELTGKFLS